MSVATLLDLAVDSIVADAVRAPSSHNTQPWRFVRRNEVLELHVERGRALPANDPDDRELFISCGTALMNLELSSSHHGLTPEAEVTADASSDLVARVRFRAGDDLTDDPMWRAIRRRSTWRGEFEDRSLADPILADLCAEAVGDGVWVHRVPDDQRAGVSELVRRATEAQWRDAAWRAELASWMRTSRSGDGLPVPVLALPVTRFVVRRLDLGARTGRRDGALTATAPALLVVGSDDDDPRAWVQVGRGLQRLLLTAAEHDIHAGYSNQPCQVRPLRSELDTLLGRAHSHVLLRLGHAAKQPPSSPRRAVVDVLDRR